MILALVMVISMCPGLNLTAFAAEEVTFSLEQSTVTAEPGVSFSLAVDASDLSSVGGFYSLLEYNTSVLTLNSVEMGKDVYSAQIISKVGIQSTSATGAVVAIDSQDVGQFHSDSKNGQILVLNFTVAANATDSDYSIVFHGDGTTDDTGRYMDSNWEYANYANMTATVTVKAAETHEHSYVDGVCSECNEPEPAKTYTVTLPESENYTVAPVEGYTTTEVEENSEFKFTVAAAEGYQVVSVLAGETPLTADENGVYTLTVTADVTVAVTVSDGKLHGGETITAGGTYQLAEDATGIITIATTDAVTIVGNGAEWDENYTMTSTVNSALYIDCSKQAGVKLTLQDVYIANSTSVTGADGQGFGIIGFTGVGNTLNFEGVNVVEYNNGGGSNPAGIHVKQGDALTIGGNGTLYFYKSAGGAGIGGSSGELNGDITFAIANMFAKGTKQGALIGAGSNSASVAGAPGAVTFESGNYNLISNSRGAVIGGAAGSSGGSSGTTVKVGPKANININVDYSGAAVGGGGYAEGNDASGGQLIVTGGSLRTYIDKNAANNATTGWNGKAFTEGVNDAAITAQRLNGDGKEVYMLAFDTTQLATAATTFEVFVDESTTAFYQGGLPEYGYVNQHLVQSEQADISSTPANWYKNGETNLYFYLTGTDHTLKVNGETFTYYWNEVTETFDTVKKANVTFYVDVDDYNIVVSEGIGYTYLEETCDGYFFEAVEGVEADEENGIEAVEAEAAKTVFPLEPGEYTFTITKSGYYASTGSFKVSEDAHAVSIATSSNINSYLKDDAFTIPMTVFTKSTNAGAWDGVTLDVSWYSETAKELHISTPAQLAGMAAINNGIYNAEITTIIDDVDGDGTTETYTPYDYAHLTGRKIIAASSTGSTGTNNLVTTLTYWYGAKSSGTYTDDGVTLSIPADFNGQTVYIDNDLDMGGYQVNGVWTGARYMTIGGQSLMHYIDYSKWKSDGYSHIGSSFNGTLDGQGHIIKNMYCDRYADGSNYGDVVSVGLVGRLGCHDGDDLSLMAVDPTVRNVAVHGYIYGRRSIGGIVGKIGQTSRSKITGDTSTGGIIENCLNFATVKNTDSKGVGGICGAGWNEGVIRNCANYGYVYAGYKNAGGISGSCEVPVINCYNVGYIDAISYTNGQAIGTDNGGATYTNVYWLTGSSLADSVDNYQWPAVWKHTSTDTLYEIETFDGFKSADFLASLNGTTRDWVVPSATDPISSIMAATAFQNCKLDVTGVTASGMPVPRCFITDTTTLTSVDKTADPTTLSYIEGQSFDTTGLEIWANWSDGTKELVTDYTVTPAGELSTDVTTVTVSGSYGGKEFSYAFTITMEANAVNEIGFNTKPTNLLYASDETFDPTGMFIYAFYSNYPTTKVVLDAEDYTTAIVADEENGGHKLVVTYTYNEKTVTAETAVTILDTPAPALNADGYYELGCTNDVLWFANQVNSLKNVNINGKVIADITMPEDFAGIGKSGKVYTGTFDGNDHTITLTTKFSSGSYALFYQVSGATIRNLTVDGSVTSSKSTSSGIAGIVGSVYTNGVTIENCVNKADITGVDYVGGIVGKIMTVKGAVNITNCRNEGTITGTSTYVGGIVGYVSGYSNYTELLKVSGCINAGAVASTSSQVGGIVGYMSSTKTQFVQIENCGNDGTVTGTLSVGGIVGYSNSVYDKITGCYNAGNVNATAMTENAGTGGIVGFCSATVENCYNVGTVTTIGSSNQYATSYLGVGGIIGMSRGTSNIPAVVRNCYNAGTLNGDSAISTGSTTNKETLYEGALIGAINYYSVTCENSYYLPDGELAAYGYSSRAQATFNGEDVPKTAEELKALAPTLGDAFKAGSPAYHSGYPLLTWETVSVLMGDVNGDGEVNGKDVLRLQKYVLGDDVEIVLDAADVNADGKLNGKDVLRLQKYVLGDDVTLG